jgi:putative Ca2+/H+ antiporter (TMEM165/GDT1 family)
MEFKLFIATFTTVFLAELGDKTQLATFVFASDPHANRLLIFAAAATALICSSAIAVFAASIAGRFINPRLLSLIAGAAFIAIGLWMVLRPQT